MAKTPTSPTGRTGRGERGVTLIELVVALGIVAMMVLLALPRFESASPGLRLRTSAEALRADLRATRNAALSLNRDEALTIDAETGAWRGPGVEGQAPPGVRITLEVAARERTGENAGAVRFYPDGASTGGVVTFRGKTAAVEVRVDWLDGRVSLGEPAEE